MPRIIDLSGIKDKTEVKVELPIEKKVMAWEGGKIKSNSKEVALKLIEKRKKEGKELDASKIVFLLR